MTPSCSPDFPANSRPTSHRIRTDRRLDTLLPMHVFLDFEASSLEKNSYPIEVAWVFEDGRSEAHLIRPAPQWTDWDETAEAVHRISRARLEAEGTPHDAVAHRILAVLSGHVVHASAPSWDGKWLSVLLRAAGLPRHAMRLSDTDEAQFEIAVEALGPVMGGAALQAAVADVIERVRKDADKWPVSHRALDDAERERRIWLAVGRLARQEAARAAIRGHTRPGPPSSGMNPDPPA